MAKSCVNHSNQPAATMCHQCHKPICKSCTMVTPLGTFCSSECSVLFREFKEKMKVGQKQGGGFGKKLVFVVLLAAAVLVGIHFGKAHFPMLAEYDYLGKLLNR